MPTLVPPTVSANGPYAGDGFRLSEHTGLLPAYTVRLVDTPGVELLLRPQVELGRWRKS